MSGPETSHGPTAPEGSRAQLAELCSDVKDRLGSIAQALAALREEIDVALRDTTAG